MATLLTSELSDVEEARMSDSEIGSDKEEREDEFSGFEERDGGREGQRPVANKDDEERRLERMLFSEGDGLEDDEDDVGFELKGFDAASTEAGVHRTSEVEEDVQALEDDQLFFLDAGPTSTAANAGALATVDSSEDEWAITGHGVPPAWVDSDDEKLVVSLASVPRLRKLRITEDEDLVGGKEYIRRLRRQYLQLHPMPQWARWDGQRAPKRKVDDSEDSSEDSDMDVDGKEQLKARPLSDTFADLKKALYAQDQPLENGRKRQKLRQDTIEVQRMKDVPGAQPSAVTSLSIHPTLPILLSAGPASLVSLHHLSPADPRNPNPPLTTLHIKKSPLTTAIFHPSPSRPQIFLGSLRRYFHVWDLAAGSVTKISRITAHDEAHKSSMSYFKLSPDGRHLALVGSSKRSSGVVSIINAGTMQWVAEIRIESRDGVADLAWWRDSTGLVVVGKNGEVTEYDVDRQRVVARWTDEGAVGTTVMCLGGESKATRGGDRWIVLGSTSGVVNVYDRSSWADGVDEQERADNGGVPRRPKPRRALDQLVTAISHLHISPDGQLLAMASRHKRDALRLVHLPSCTVYQNWPTSRTAFGRVSAVAWARADAAGENAEREGVVCVLVTGNEAGRIRLWEVRG